MRHAPPALALLAAALLAGPPASGQAATAPADAEADSAGTALEARIAAAGRQMKEVIPGSHVFLDPEARARNRDRVVPALVEMRGLLGEAAALGQPQPAAEAQFDVLLAIYEHEGTVKRLEAEAAGDSDAADGAAATLLTADTMRAEDDAARARVAERFAARAAARPASAPLARLGSDLVRVPGTDRAFQLQVLDAMDNRLAGEAAADAADEAAVAMLFVDTVRAGDDAARARVAQRFAARAQARPGSVPLAELGSDLVRVKGVDAAFQLAVLDVLEDRLTSEAATGAAARLRPMAEANAKLEGLVGQPLVLEGTTADGEPVSTADWRGRVVLVDFWATWCPPCVAEMPRLEALHAARHGDGLEILGVNSDATAEVLVGFVGKRPGMVWPQLFAADNAGLHPINLELGVFALPRMFLIDRAGVVRSVNAADDYEAMILELLAEDPAG